MEANKTYVVHVNVAADEKDMTDASGEIGEAVFETAGVEIYRASDTTDTKVTQANDMAAGDVIVVGATEIAAAVFTDADGMILDLKRLILVLTLLRLATSMKLCL